MKITIPNKPNHHGLKSNLITAEISDKCPVCGGPRAGIRWTGVHFCSETDKGLKMSQWKNSCGHIDTLESVLKEIKRNQKPVIQFVYEAYHEMPEVFNSNVLIDRVRDLTNRPRLQDGTILRLMRMLKFDEKRTINFECISRVKSEYKKL